MLVAVLLLGLLGMVFGMPVAMVFGVVGDVGMMFPIRDFSGGGVHDVGVMFLMGDGVGHDVGDAG